MKIAFAALAALFFASAVSASPVSVTELLGEDTFFEPDGFTVITEAEGRAGGGSWEFGLGKDGEFGQRDRSWSNGEVDFDLSYVAATNTLNYQVGSLALMTTTIDLSSANAFLIRTGRGNEGGSGNFVRLTDLAFNSQDLTPSSLESNDDFNLGNFLFLTGIDGSQDWTLEGKVFINAGSQAKPAFQVKIGELEPAVIPLPAAAWMLLAGIGGLVAVGRRRAA
jgi:hypothetical protein